MLITSLVNELIDEMAPLQTAEFVAEFAMPLHVRVITLVMGFQLADIPKLKKYSEAWVLPFRGGLTKEEEDCPAHFNLDRKNSARHMAFSLGETRCTAAGLSRLEQNIAFDTLIARLAHLRLAEGRNNFTHHPDVTLRALKELWVSWD